MSGDRGFAQPSQSTAEDGVTDAVDLGGIFSAGRLHLTALSVHPEVNPADPTLAAPVGRGNRNLAEVTWVDRLFPGGR